MREHRSEVEVEAEPAEVWERIGTAAGLAGWLADEVEGEVRPGGDLRLTEDGEDRRALVESVQEDRRLVLWWWRGEEPATRVEVVLVPLVARTKVVVTERSAAGEAWAAHRLTGLARTAVAG